MGIFTSNTYGTAIDIYSPAEQELQVEGMHINFYEAGMVAVSECESVYNKAMKEIGIGELHYMEENGHEVIYEAVDFAAVKEKIKNFFKKLIDKVKSILHAFITKLSSWTSQDKEFVKKYEKEFSRKWNDVKDDFEFKGYTFTLGKDFAEGALTAPTNFDNIPTFKAKSTHITVDLSGTNVTPTDPATTGKDINSDVTGLRESRDDIEEEMRAEVCKAFGNACECSKTPTTTKMDAKEYSTALFEMFRNGESSKENVEKKDLSVSTILEDLRTSATTKKLAEKATKAVLKTIDDCIKGLEKSQTAIGKEDVGKEDDKINLRNAKVAATVEVASFARTNREYIVQANAAYLQALADRSRQNKAIMTKVIAGGKKMQRESYDYTNESYSTGSFLDSVVLK